MGDLSKEHQASTTHIARHQAGDDCVGYLAGDTTCGDSARLVLRPIASCRSNVELWGRTKQVLQMAWVIRGGRRYFYEVQKQNGRVITRYRGTGPAAEQAARELELRKEERLQRQELRRHGARQHQLRLTPGRQLDRELALLVRAQLVAAGLYQHRRSQWRHRRGRSES